jgi:hypothetical protein
MSAEAGIQRTVSVRHATGFRLALRLAGMTKTIPSTQHSVLSTSLLPLTLAFGPVLLFLGLSEQALGCYEDWVKFHAQIYPFCFQELVT